MAFRFRFQSVLDHRRLVEEQRQRELAICLRRKAELEDLLRQTQQTLRGNKQQLAESLIGHVDMSQLGGYARYASHMTVRGMDVVRRIAAASNQAEEARARLLDATKRVKALELLRDRELAQWKKARKKAEAAHLDEVAVQQHARRQRSAAREQQEVTCS